MQAGQKRASPSRALLRDLPARKRRSCHIAAELHIADRVGGAPVPLPEHCTEGALAGGGDTDRSDGLAAPVTADEEWGEA